LEINSKFSLTDIFLATAVSCGETLIIRLTDCGSLMMLFPINNASPLVGSSKQDNIFIVVVFPAPFVPSSPKSSPSLTNKRRVSTAVRFLNFLVNSFIAMPFFCPPPHSVLVHQTLFQLAHRINHFSEERRVGKECRSRIRNEC